MTLKSPTEVSFAGYMTKSIACKILGFFLIKCYFFKNSINLHVRKGSKTQLVFYQQDELKETNCH